MGKALKIRLPLFAALLLLAFLSGCPSEEKTEGSQYVCPLIGAQANAVGIKGADLGIPVARGDGSIWILFGDVTGMEAGKGGASALAVSPSPFDCNSIYWKKSGEAFYQPLRSARTFGDSSTVPSGAIELNGTMYIYSMRVIQWGAGYDPSTTRGHGMLFREENETFSEVFSWGEGVHLNTAPALGALPDGKSAVFMALSGKYRDSPIYLAYVLPSEIENPGKYHYFAGMEGGAPKWANFESAVPLEGMENMKAGELSLVYNPILRKYLLMSKDYSQGANAIFNLYSSSDPWGPYSLEKSFTPCVGSSGRPSWMEEGWGGCYGGYIFPDSFGADGKDIYFTVSVWKPYITIVSKGRMD